MIGRLFFIIAMFILGWLAFRYFRGQLMLKEQQEEVHDNNQKVSIEEIKACSFCGLHMPEGEMLSKDKRHFCSYQHMLDFEQKK